MKKLLLGLVILCAAQFSLALAPYLKADKLPAADMSVQQGLVKALGDGSGFGGDVPQDELADYHYMFGMARFDSANSELSSHASFAEALKTVQGNLACALRALPYRTGLAGLGHGAVHGHHQCT